MSAPSKKQKKPGSLTRKLTWRQVWSVLRILILMDIAVTVLFFAGLFGWCESMMRSAADGSFSVPQETIGYTIAYAREEPAPSGWFSGLQYRFGGMDRHLVIPPAGGPFLRRLEKLEYTVTLPTETGALRGCFYLGDWTALFIRMMKYLAAFQGIILLLNVFRTRRSVKQVLRPIEKLTLTARSMTEPLRRAAAPQDLKLSGAIDTINTINEEHLDMRIAIADEREELQGLGQAINSMLDRLNAAYQSQLRFVSDASHELRTPIAVIQGYANLLDRWGKTDEKTLQESIDAIKSETAGMQDLVEQLLFLARSDNNSIRIHPELVDVPALAGEVLKDTQLIDQTHVFSVNAEDGLVVEADAQLLKQAVRILMDNAIKYTPKGERIGISVSRHETWVRLAVTDNGIGIAEEDLPQVFDRFFRADESRTRQSGGTGLGLSIAKWIVDRHGGYLEVLSRKDIGTRMTIVLPARETKELPQEDQPAV